MIRPRCLPHLLALLLAFGAGPVRAQAPPPVRGTLTVFNAGSLAGPFRDLLAEFRSRNPDLEVRQESAGSLESARKLTELGRIPDVLAVADFLVIPNLLVPSHATWYLSFARNAMVLIHTPGSRGAGEITTANWWRILLRQGVRIGRSNPDLDPNGYRTLMALELAERHYREPGLSARLLAAMPRRYMRPKEADLTALVQAGELDYSWSYRSIAVATGLSWVELPAQVNLGDPALAEWYAGVEVRVPGPRRAESDSVTLRGEPIVYGLTIPTRVRNPAAARAFVRFVLSPDGAAILRRHGFDVLDHPVTGGPGRPPAGLVPGSRVSQPFDQP